jgi:hypothetical protein
MAAIFFAMVFAGWVPAALLILGLVMSSLATVLYARMGIAAARRSRDAHLQASGQAS